MESSESKNILLSVLGVAILFVAVVGISYAVFVFTSDGKQESTLSTGTISMKYTESDTNIISIQNAVPTSDEIGKNQTDYFDFVISSTISGNASVDYEVRAAKIDVSPNVPISDSDIKLYLEKKQLDKYIQVLTPTEFKINNKTNLNNPEVDTNSMLLYKGRFNNHNSNKSTYTDEFRLRMWLKETASLDEVSKTFKVKVNVYASIAN